MQRLEVPIGFWQWQLNANVETGVVQLNITASVEDVKRLFAHIAENATTDEIDIVIPGTLDNVPLLASEV